MESVLLEYLENSTRVLVIESSESKIKLFKSLLSDKTVDFSSNVEESISMLESLSYDLVFIGYHFIDNHSHNEIDKNDCTCGSMVIDYIRKNLDIFSSLKVVIHCLNEKECKKLNGILPNALLVQYFLIQKRTCMLIDARLCPVS